MSAKFGIGFIAATIFGVVFSLFGTILYFLWPGIYDNILNSKLELTPGSSSYDLWEVTPIPMYIEFYLFNWTNPEDIDDHSLKPHLVELGPYVFREHRRKVIKEWCNENSTITFLQNRTWFFEPDLSNGSLDDLVTTINVPAVTAAFAVRNAPSLVKFGLSLAMGTLGTKIHVTKTAREFLFDGYSDPLLNLASYVPSSFVPVQIPFDKFGWFYARNGSATYDGVFNMYTGVSDITKFGEIGEWNYMNHTHFYPSECGKVNGSAGEFFPPYQDKSDVSLFSSDVCRTLTLAYKEPVEVDGIPGYRYWGDDTMFDNKTSKPQNWCYCPSGECPPNGAIDVSSCKFGAPAFISFPHFYHGDQSYRDAVDGMHPDESKHQMYMDIEPRSGIPMKVSAAMQINILMQPDTHYTFIKHVPKIYFPCLWFKQTARIDNTIGPTVRMVSELPSIGTIVSLVMLSAGLSVIAIIGIYFLTKKCRKEEDTVVLNTSPVSTGPSSSTSRSRLLSKLEAAKTHFQSYFNKQKILPVSENVIQRHSFNNGYGNGIDGKCHAHAVVISPLTLKTDCPFDTTTALLAQQTIRSRRSSQVSIKGEEIAPFLYIDEDLSTGVTDNPECCMKT